MSRRNRRRLVLGEAGPVPALVLAGMALVVAFIVTAGPLALTVAGNRATRQAVAGAPSADVGTLISSDVETGTGHGAMTAARMDALAGALAATLPMPGKFPVARRWSGLSVPNLSVLNAAPSATASGPPILEVDYRGGLASNSALLAGALPGKPAEVKPRTAKALGSVTLTVAVTKATATRFSVGVGSVLNLGRAFPGGPLILLKVTGIVRPVGLNSAFWQLEPVLAVPEIEGSQTNPFWAGAVFTGPGDLSALTLAYSGDAEQVSWFFPITTDLTTADVPALEASLAALASSPQVRHAEQAEHDNFLQNTTVTTGLGDGLATYTAQWRSTSGADSMLVVGLFVAGLVLLLVCCGLATAAYRTELTVLRVRGGGLLQLGGRMLARCCAIVLPALVIGIGLAVLAVPGGLAGISRTAEILTGLVALTAIAGTPVSCVLAHRKPHSADRGWGGEGVAGRSSGRRLTAEILVILVACAAIADLRYRGATAATGAGPGGPASLGGTGVYLSVSAVLVAAVVGLLVNRAYRGPLRALARAATARKGPVGAVGLARAASSASSAWPALALMLALTLAAFSVMVGASVSAGQVTASWEQVGSDAMIAVGGSASAVSAGESPVTAAELRAVERVPGVKHVTTVYTAPNLGAEAVTLRYGSVSSAPIGIAVVDPAPYAVLAADTPWPSFPAAALAKPASGATTAVPILVSPGVAATAARHGTGGTTGLRLAFSGISVPARIIGTITNTAAMPAGGSFVLMPLWAASRLPSLPQPSTILVTGPAINLPALRATVRRMLPGSRLAVRRQVLNDLATTPVLHMSAYLYLIGAVAAIALSALAVLFSLATSTRSRGLMMTRLAALGMDRTQSLLLVLTDAVPLLSVAVVGTVASSWLLAEVVGPVLGLNVFTGSSVPVDLRPTWLALVVPLAGVAVLALAYLAVDGIAAARRHVGAALRLEEAH